MHLSRIFQSTSSVWRTTAHSSAIVALSVISIHVLRVEDDGRKLQHGNAGVHFNPRPPCGGRQETLVWKERRSVIFQSTSSVWRTTFFQPGVKFPHPNFNPRPPCGGRRTSTRPACLTPQFQSTSSVWRTTPLPHTPPPAGPISIHVLRVEDDTRPPAWPSSQPDFNPRPPCGGRRRAASGRAPKW